jgi:mono/diheme cytochrome c family protein
MTRANTFLSAARAFLLIGALAHPARSQESAAPAERPMPDELAAAPAFFEQHCVKCHGPAKHKANLRLDLLRWDEADETALEHWQTIVDRLTAGEMPPESEPRPDSARTGELVLAIRAALEHHAASARRPTVLRRLNRAQYRNTLRDLLAIDVRMEDPTSSFPADDVVAGFDNLGEGLTMSDYLLRQYLRAARAAVDLATFEGERPAAETYRMFDPGSTRTGSFEINHIDTTHGQTFLFMNDERSPGDTRGQVLTTSRDGAPHAGWYEFTFEVESKGRGPLPATFPVPQHEEWQTYHPEDLHRLEIYLSAPLGWTPLQIRNRILVDSLDLADDERVRIERRYWLEPGWRVEVAFGNAWAGLVAGYVARLGGPSSEALTSLSPLERFELYATMTYDLVERANAPRIVIHAASEHGPLYDSWPPASQVRVWGDPATPLEERVRLFAERAFRRGPVGLEELEPFVRLAHESPEGLRTAVEAILCSPRFAYLLENEGALDGYALAARLSYFLWNTMPDAELLAAVDELADPAQLRAQCERLLADPRSDEFVEHFTFGWLKLQNALDLGPDPMKFPEYHRNRIGTAMVTETRRFFRTLLDQDLSIANLISSDFTFVNADLARLYGIEGVHTTADFQRVTLAPEQRRGGLLGMASVLTASANGVDTSPVVRGSWVLDNLLGMPPDPPPEGVVFPDPDARGELTIREVYAKHRTEESCNECHKSIDPLGFALEAFDPIGRWRETYESGLHIDPSGTMPDGQPFDDVIGMKRVLLADLQLFARSLTTKLLTYASGRTLGIADRGEVDRIVAAVGAQGYGLRDLVLAVVTSSIFTHR